jgi:tetratricopeptide (TPR) repeat protein
MLRNQRRADRILDSLYVRYPNHPGLAHYLIHANDSPQLASLGLNAARRYARIAPDVPHALHMPSHIFLRLGLWDEAIASNEKATAAGRRYQAEQQMAGTWFHNLHTLEFLETGYLQEGRDAEALRIVKQVDSVSAITPPTPLGAARWLAVIPLRYALERGAWHEAAALRLHPVPESGPGTALAATRFARALGSARFGDSAAARAEVRELESIVRSLRERNKPEDAEYVETLRQAAGAWLALATGDTAQALTLARSAAERQDMTVEAPYLFARELQGELLLQVGRSAEALKAFEAALRLVPHRARSLYGAALAAQQSGNSDAARKYYHEFVGLMAKGDGQRPELQAAQRFLASR